VTSSSLQRLTLSVALLSANAVFAQSKTAGSKPKSDKARRDGFLQRSTLETSKYPQVELVPVSLDGIDATLPSSGSKTFALVGALTVHGVTRPTTWRVTARADGKDVVGTAVTAFTFKDFELVQPRVPAVLSVADTIKVEYDFRFAAEPDKR